MLAPSHNSIYSFFLCVIPHFPVSPHSGSETCGVESESQTHKAWIKLELSFNVTFLDWETLMRRPSLCRLWRICFFTCAFNINKNNNGNFITSGSSNAPFLEKRVLEFVLCVRYQINLLRCPVGKIFLGSCWPSLDLQCMLQSVPFAMRHKWVER